MTARPDSVAALLRRRADDDHEALRFEGRSWSWREVVAESNRRANLMRDLLADGPPHVGVMLDNVPEYLFLFGGAALTGSVIVGINPTRRGAERAADIAHTDCQIICTDERRAELVGTAAGAAPDRVFDVTTSAWQDLVADASAGPPSGPPPTASTLFLLIFTSGSTGAPKAVKCSQGRLARSAAWGFQPDDVLYCSMPLFHGNALWSNWVPAIAAGATVVLKRRFSASSFLPDVREEGVTFVNTVGRALAYVLATPPTSHDRDHRLKVVLAPESSAHDIAAFRERFGCPVIEGYGSSEGVIQLAPGGGSAPGSLGRPMGKVDLAVIDPDTLEECPPAEFDESGALRNADEAIGELVRRDAGSLFEGYYRNDDAESARMRNGWFWSGDLVYRDRNGDLFFAGRTDDWLRVDGENFAAAPVERILSRYPPFAGVAVYGVPDPRTGDQVMAAVELHPGASLDIDDFQRFLQTQPDLGTKWAPRFVRIVDRLPATATNKIDKKPLRRERWDAANVWWQPDRDSAWVPVTADVQAALLQAFSEHGRSHLVGA